MDKKYIQKTVGYGYMWLPPHKEHCTSGREHSTENGWVVCSSVHCSLPHRLKIPVPPRATGLDVHAIIHSYDKWTTGDGEYHSTPPGYWGRSVDYMYKTSDMQLVVATGDACSAQPDKPVQPTDKELEIQALAKDIKECMKKGEITTHTGMAVTTLDRLLNVVDPRPKTLAELCHEDFTCACSVLGRPDPIAFAINWYEEHMKNLQT